MAPLIRGNSLYLLVDDGEGGRSWLKQEENAVKLGGHLTSIQDKS